MSELETKYFIELTKQEMLEILEIMDNIDEFSELQCGIWKMLCNVCEINLQGVLKCN